MWGWEDGWRWSRHSHEEMLNHRGWSLVFKVLVRFTMYPCLEGKTGKLGNCQKRDGPRGRRKCSRKPPSLNTRYFFICLAVYSLCCFFKLFVIFNFSLLWRMLCVHEIWSYIVSILDHTSLNMVFSQLIHVYRDVGPSIHQGRRIPPVAVPSGY